MRRAVVLAAFLSGLSIVFLLVTATAAGAATAFVSADTGHAPLVVLGMMLLATGLVLLRRPVAIPNP